MKIVRIIARLNVGGPARHAVWLTKEFNNAEFRTALFTGMVPPGEEDMSWFAAENDVSPIFIEELSRELSIKDIVSLWKIYRKIKVEEPDIIHTHTAKAGTIGRLAGLFYRILHRKKVNIVHTFHGHIFHSYYGGLKTKIFLLIERLLARFATDKIVVISQQQFEEIHSEFGVGKKEQFRIIPLGIDLEKFSKPELKRGILRSELGVSEAEILVGFVGRLTDIKNISLILQVAKVCSERYSSEASTLRFVIVGDGNLRSSLEAEAISLGLDETVTFIGNRDRVDEVYAGFDVVALTSLNEGTPLSLIEAMANGIPVISTAVGGVVDLVGQVESDRDGFQVCERGILVDSNNVAGYLNGLINLAQDKDMRDKLGTNGKSYVAENYSKERLFDDLRRLYVEF